MSTPNKVNSEEILLKNEELENYFANTIIPQLFVDANFILRKFTPPAMRHFSLTSKDLDKNIRLVKENIRYPTLIENITEVITTGEILEKEIQTTDGSWFQMNILPYVERKENRTNGVIITFVDITHRIETLRELEKLNAQHDTLIYALSHDIRQPLSMIVLINEGLSRAYDRRDSGMFKEWLDQLRTSSDIMKSMVNDFIQENGNPSNVKNREERVNIENIAGDVITALKNEIHNKDIDLSTEFKTSEIKFSRNNLRSILYNLINNAIKYKDPGRPLGVSLSTEKIKGYIILRVKDNGVGIPKEYHVSIFQKATRLNHELEGTGMGLYIIKRMVEDSGGKVELESSPGKGSTFSVYFKSEYPGEVSLPDPK